MAARALRHVIFGASTLLIASAAGATTCNAIAGIELALQDQKRFVIVGERHGTAQIPAFFADLVCSASARGPVVVGLEIEAHQQASLDAYLESDGGPEARAALLRQSHWRLSDGRASQAMLRLVERLRAMKDSGRDIAVLASMLPADTLEGREESMAEAWLAGLRARPTACLLALVGNVHAETEAIGFAPSAASYLPPSQRLTLNYVPLTVADGRGRILDRAPPEWVWPRFDLYYAVGGPLTTSPRASEPGR